MFTSWQCTHMNSSIAFQLFHSMIPALPRYIFGLLFNHPDQFIYLIYISFGFVCAAVVLYTSFWRIDDYDQRHSTRGQYSSVSPTKGKGKRKGRNRKGSGGNNAKSSPRGGPSRNADDLDESLVRLPNLRLLCSVAAGSTRVDHVQSMSIACTIVWP